MGRTFKHEQRKTQKTVDRKIVKTNQSFGGLNLYTAAAEGVAGFKKKSKGGKKERLTHNDGLRGKSNLRRGQGGETRSSRKGNKNLVKDLGNRQELTKGESTGAGNPKKGRSNVEKSGFSNPPRGNRAFSYGIRHAGNSGAWNARLDLAGKFEKPRGGDEQINSQGKGGVSPGVRRNAGWSERELSAEKPEKDGICRRPAALRQQK